MREGDIITFDLKARRLDVELSAEQITERMQGWTPPPPRYSSGVFAKYGSLVSSVSEGAVTRV